MVWRRAHHQLAPRGRKRSLLRGGIAGGIEDWRFLLSSAVLVFRVLAVSKKYLSLASVDA